MRETSLDEFVGGAVGGEADGEDDANGDDEPGVADAADGSDGAEEDDVDLESDHEPEPEAEPEPEPEADGESESDSDPEPVEPAVSTYDWTPTGADCEACGAAVERRWRDDGRLVCPDCKAW